MTDHIEGRLLKLAEKATPGPWSGLYGEHDETITIGHDGTETTMTEGDATYIASCSPEVVAAMCRVVAAARRIGHHGLCDYVNALGKCDCQIGSALAALDAMEEKTE